MFGGSVFRISYFVFLNSNSLHKSTAQWREVDSEDTARQC